MSTEEQLEMPCLADPQGMATKTVKTLDGQTLLIAYTELGCIAKIAESKGLTVEPGMYEITFKKI